MTREYAVGLGLVLFVSAFLLAFLAGATSGISISYGNVMLYTSLAMVAAAGGVSALWWACFMEKEAMDNGDVAEIIAIDEGKGIAYCWVRLLSKEGRAEIQAPGFNASLERGTKIVYTKLGILIVESDQVRQKEE